MSNVTEILAQIDQGDPAAAELLLPLVYAELRALASAKLAREPAGQTLQATALVHEAYLRLVHRPNSSDWDSRGHFFAAAAEAMRRILVENARRKASLKQGGQFARRELDEATIAADEKAVDLLELDDALTRLGEVDEVAAKLVKLRFFAGLTMEQVAEVCNMSPRTAYYTWTYARAWLSREMRKA